MLDDRSLLERVPAIVYVADVGASGRWHYVSPQIEPILGYTQREWLADPDLWSQRLHPDDRELALSPEDEPVHGAGASSALEYRMLARDGRVVWVRDDAWLVEGPDGEPRWHGVLSDVTDRRLAEEELTRIAAQQQAVARLGERALEGADLGTLLDEAVAAASETLDVEVGAVLELAPDGDSLTIRAAHGPAGPELGARVPAHEGSQAGHTLGLRAPVIVADWSTETRFSQPSVLSDVGARSGVTVVIDGPEQPYGVLGIQSLSVREFRALDVDFLQSLANVLADAIHRHAREDEIRHQALHDALTGLPNRVLFMDRLAHALAGLERREGAAAVLFLDIDRFKLVNDSLGHQAGDDLLTAVAPRLQAALRPTDTVARFGGDEFGILIEDVAGEREAAEVAERLAAGFARPFLVAGSDHFVTVSIGIVVAEGGGHSPDELLRNADAAMYRAKDRGRARYELYDEVMRARAVGRLRIENELRRALERDELRLHYQPVVNLRDGSISGVEALLRWEHPQRGLVAPGDFIPVAEESGLIEPIGAWVLEQACTQAAAWQARRPDAAPLGVSVNLSARQVAQRDLAPTVERILERAGLQPSCLSLEITESVLLEDSEAPATTLRALREAGVRLVLDDFGTGYSSLGYLRRLPLDALKVDRSFVDELAREPQAAAIVRAVVGMAHGLSMAVIAEGVETRAQLAELLRMGCGAAQGYLFARPLPAHELEPLLDRAPDWMQLHAPVVD
jgi:diguanylate cyclase (GGDEF)-like protein/PAS domain S-box-containing protein